MKKVLSIAIVAMLILFLLLSTVSCAGKTVSMSEAASGSATERNDVVLYADTIQTVQDTVQKVLDQETSAVTVAIMVNNEIVYSEGFSSSEQTIDTRTGFNVGSIGKLFTMVSALQLADRGELDLDAPVTDYLPQFQMKDIRYKDITARMLLNHSPGLPGTYNYNIFATEPDPDYLSNVIRHLKSETLKSDPGTISVYSNDGWTLLQLVIEAVTQTSLIDYVQTHVFTPAGMTHSYASAQPLDDNIARIASDGVTFPREVVNALGAGGFTSTAEDLCYFSRALFSGTLLSEEMLVQCTSKQTAPNTIPFGEPYYNFGYGWDFISMPQFDPYGVHVFGKNGGTAQFSSQLNVLPSEGVAIAVSLCGEGTASSVAYDITIALLEDLGYSAEPDVPVIVQPASIPADMLKYEGYYGGAYLYHITFDIDQNTLNEEVLFLGTMYPLEEAQYMDDDAFYTSTSKIMIDERLGNALLLTDLQGRYDVLGEALAPNSHIDASAFTDETWIPYDLSLTDLLTDVLNTDAFEPLPGYIMAGFGSSLLPYRLVDKHNTTFALSHVMDQLELSIQNINGQDIVTAAGYLFQRKSDALSLVGNEAISFDLQGYNIARTITKSGTLTVESSGEYRIVVFRNTSKWEDVYDSLLQSETLIVVQEGDVLLLVGQPQETIFITYNP